MIVVDASVIAKWFLPEAGTEEAMALIEGPLPLIAPSLIRLEVYSAITRRYRMGEIHKDEAVMLCGKWAERLRQGAVALVPDVEILDLAIAQALKLRHALLIVCTSRSPNYVQFPSLPPIRRSRSESSNTTPQTYLLSQWQAN